VQVGDLGGSLLALAGILAALVQAQRTGEGDHIDVSLTDAAFALLSIHLGDYFATGVVPERERMLLNGLYPSYNVYACADGKCLAVGALEEQFFVELCEAVGRPELAATHRDPQAVPAWRSLFQSRPRAEWLALLEGHDACVGPVNDVGEACAEPLFADREMIVQVDHPASGTVRQIGVPIKARMHPARIGGAAPRLGEGTRRYLAEVGYLGQEIEELLAAGVVSAPPTLDS
jgi:crotonobetainyl-CoA:carnitine CoA-transferase CaiB-like acyl-CoA transferase